MSIPHNHFFNSLLEVAFLGFGGVPQELLFDQM